MQVIVHAADPYVSEHIFRYFTWMSRQKYS